MKPRPLAVQPEELRAIRRAFCLTAAETAPGAVEWPWTEGAESRLVSRAGSSDFHAPSGGHLM
jgi:hypothetical protein